LRRFKPASQASYLSAGINSRALGVEKKQAPDFIGACKFLARLIIFLLHPDPAK
jgi:hypothetical protein